MFLILILLICLFVEYEIVAIHSDRSKRLTMLNDNGRSKQRIINANDLSNVFSNKVTPTKRNEIQFSYSDNDEANLYNDEEDDDESTVKDSNSNKQIPDDSSDTIKSSFNNKNNERTSADTDSKYNNLNDMNDKDIFAAPPKMSDFNVESELGDEYDSFMNLDGDLGKAATSRISDQLSVDESYEVFAENRASPRVFQYEPISKIEINPMAYGAYRRAKLPPTPTKKEASTKSGRQNKDKKKGPKNDTNSFYDAIKNLGSGPTAQGSGSVTGLAEPPPGKKSILPRKAPTEKKRRKIVTPDEINSIFSKKGTDSDNDIFSDKSSRSSASNNDDADDDSEVENEEVVETGASVGGFANELGQKFQAAYAQAMNKVEDRSITDTATDSKNSMSMDARSMSSEVNAFDNELTSGNPVDQFSDASVTGDDQIPNWLLKADRVAEKKKKEAMLKGRKKKQLTDDWRFWLGIIATAGFASAAYSMYQQTGGFDPNISPFSSFGFGPSDVTGGGGDELII